MTEHGTKFRPPKISSNAYPGSWTFLKGDSRFVAAATAMVLDYIVQDLHCPVPSPSSITIHKAGSQIVSGIKVYLEMSILQPNMDIQALIYHPSFMLHEKSSEAKVEKIFITSKTTF
jgi:hypothetical protein